MRTLNKPEITITLLFFASCLLWYLFSDVFILTVGQLFKNNIFSSIGFLTKEIIIVLVCGGLLFFGAKAFRLRIYQTHYQYYRLFEHNPTPMLIVNLKTNKFVSVNKAALDGYGYTYKEFLSLPITAIGSVAALDFLKDSTATNGEIINVGCREHKSKQGQKILTDISYSRVTFKRKDCVLLLATDITEAVKAREEQENAEQERRRQYLFTSYVLENFPVDVAVFDKDHKYLLLNKVAVRDDEMRKWMIGKDDFEYFARKGTGLSIAEKRRERFLQAIEGKSIEWIDEHIIDGKVRYKLRKFLPYSENGELKYVYGYGTDITELRKAEIQREEYLQQLEKMAFSTSHKIRQPICNLKGLISLLKSEEGNNHEIISNLEKSVDLMDDFTRDLGEKLHEFKQNLSPNKE